MDPLLAFSAAASIVQLIDVSLRASREIYGFLAAVKGARKEIQDLKSSLLEVQSNIESLRDYIDKSSKPKKSMEESEGLQATTITRSLVGFQEDLAHLKKILPYNSAPSLAQKVRWVYSGRKVAYITQRLRDRKTDLTVALTIAGCQHQLRLSEDNDDIRASLSIIQEEMVELHNYSLSQLSRSSTLVEDREAYKPELSHDQPSLSCSPGTPFFDYHDSRYQTNISAPSIDILTKVFRGELRSSLRPIIERASKTTVQHEARLYRIEAMIDRMSYDLGRNISDIGLENPSEPGMRKVDEIARNILICEDQTKSKSDIDMHDISSIVFGYGPSPDAAERLPTSAQSLLMKCLIGSVQVDVESGVERKYGLPTNYMYTSICVTFRPGQAWLTIPGLSIFYSTAPNRYGFYQIAPSITTFPIISRHSHPVYEAIVKGEMQKVRQLLWSGEVNPRCQDEYGATLLHWAVLFARLELCKLLFSYGLTWDQRDCDGHTVVHVAASIIFRFCRLATSTTPTGAEAIQTIQFIADTGGDMSQIIQPPACRSVQLSMAKPYLKGIRYLDSQYSADAWQFYFGFWEDVWWRSNYLSLDVLSSALDNGLEPDLRFQKSGRTLLFDAIVGMRCVTNGEERTQDQNQNSMVTREDGEKGLCEKYAKEDESQNIGVPPWSIVARLILAGADIHNAEPKSFDKATHWRDIRTPCEYACVHNVEKQWCEALLECGLVPEMVYQEDCRRRKQAIRLHGATRSGLDEEVLALPSTRGLRYRKYRRFLAFSQSETQKLGQNCA